ncbi:MAG: hypothetical protein ACUVR3_01820, partial [Candidatus Roseilinea sp.]|uniref:hypothetical protein n=1 Tax=Candidatus Roseilinea sp. TaxID=2838777 RepID=UPI004049F645
NEVKRAVRGKTVGEAQSALLEKFALRSNPIIEVGPDWLTRFINRLPFVTLRITTTIKRE